MSINYVKRFVVTTVEFPQMPPSFVDFNFASHPAQHLFVEGKETEQLKFCLALWLSASKCLWCTCVEHNYHLNTVGVTTFCIKNVILWRIFFHKYFKKNVWFCITMTRLRINPYSYLNKDKS
ncbi:hypothetical protein JZ751_028001 [Albula glossodonta]|uniref:Uncharacterized protein n=1 Tax=Albula glossodonta TaxID=121402 RepID=A0A8T2PAC4_9TELE|nr:hypothetical protein JZ751_028001 [Albula glossodonta]